MAGGIRRRPRRLKPAPAPAAEEPADFAELFDEPEGDSTREGLPVGDDDAPPAEEPEHHSD
jgi:hypothetical protein